MRALVSALGLALGLAAAGCTSWVVDGDTGWLPLSGTPTDVDPLPSLTLDTSLSAPYYVGPDRRTYLFDHAPELGYDSSGQAFFRLRAIDFSVAPLIFPAAARITPDGVLTVEQSSDPNDTRAFFTLHRLGSGPDLQLPHPVVAGTLAIEALRGPGYISVHYSLDFGGRSAVLFDDGRALEIDSAWVPMADPISSAGIWAVANGDPRWLLATGGSANAAGYAVIDLQSGAVVPLAGAGDQVSAVAPDWPHARAVFCDLARGAYAVDFASGTRHDLGVPSCVRLFVDSGRDGFLGAQDGGMWRLPAGANQATFVRSVEPFDRRSVKDGNFVYAAPNDSFSGFLDGQRVIEHGIKDSFSSDGRTLRWLENATNATVGDLYRRDVASGQVRHLQHNVTEFAELPDGRVAAIADADFEGRWNRAVLLDEAHGVAHWLANDVQHVHVAGDTIIVGRNGDAGNVGVRIWALPIPPP
jgi:hypothetical protein